MMHRKPRPGLACGVFGREHPGDARSLAAFAVDGCVPMSGRCRLCRTATTSRCPAPRTGIWGSASLGRPARAEACLFGLCEVGTSALPKRGSPLSRPVGRAAIQRTRNGPGARNPQSPPAHDASRSSPVGWDACRIGAGWWGGDKFRGGGSALSCAPSIVCYGSEADAKDVCSRNARA